MEENKFNYITRAELSINQKDNDKYVFTFKGEKRCVENHGIEFWSQNTTIKEIISGLNLEEIDELWIQKRI